MNYEHLHDPFSDKEDEAYHVYATTIYQAILGTDDPKTLREARSFDDRSEWEKAIHVELDQLKKFGTWKLVECPSNTIPIPNKWVFLKKYNKEGELTKYKARLVVKGCAQQPGFNYSDTFSLVVRLETIRAILSIVPTTKLKMHQMNVKGAYLNSILKEKVYMCQPDSFDNGTNQVCCLQKTLYSLKQSGHEWNKELDQRLKEKGFENLQSDPCAYIRRQDDSLEILTVWVDDLLLFASIDRVMINLKGELSSTFDVTDLGEPSKIVGIEIVRGHSSLLPFPFRQLPPDTRLRFPFHGLLN